MGKVGQALRQVLESYGISQNKLAARLGVKPYAVYRWYYEQIDPRAETAVDIVKALQSINPEAAKDFVRLYIGEMVEDEE